MDSRVVHFGFDDCHRLELLRSQGYEVNEAGSLAELITHLRSATIAVDAVVLSEDEEMKPASILRAVRRETGAPVVLFRRTNREIDVRGFDRVFEWLTPPGDWLPEASRLIAAHRGLSNAAD